MAVLATLQHWFPVKGSYLSIMYEVWHQNKPSWFLILLNNLNSVLALSHLLHWKFTAIARETENHVKHTFKRERFIMMSGLLYIQRNVLLNLRPSANVPHLYLYTSDSVKHKYLFFFRNFLSTWSCFYQSNITVLLLLYSSIHLLNCISYNYGKWYMMQKTDISFIYCSIF